MRYQILLSVVLLCLPGMLMAADTESARAIRAAVLDIVGRDAEITLDPALKMPRCGEHLHARRINNGTMEVSCPRQSGWRLFVPVRIRRDQLVLVLTRAISAGEAITADMLAQETRDATRIIGAPLTDPASAIGQISRRALPVGSVLAAAHLHAPGAVQRGDQVTLVMRQSGIEVRMAGRALTAGRIGERISAENLSSRRRIQGVVMDNGELRIQH